MNIKEFDIKTARTPAQIYTAWQLWSYAMSEGERQTLEAKLEAYHNR